MPACRATWPRSISFSASSMYVIAALRSSAAVYVRAGTSVTNASYRAVDWIEDVCPFIGIAG
ncbi:hypothetical protein D3C78_1972040 [compost metagenome]